MNEPCSCPLAGFCVRQQRYMPSVLHDLCQNSPAHRRVFLASADVIAQGTPTQIPTAASIAPTRHIACRHLGSIRDRLDCNCPQRWIMDCAKHEKCTTGAPREGIACCQSCPDYDPFLTSS